MRTRTLTSLTVFGGMVLGSCSDHPLEGTSPREAGLTQAGYSRAAAAVPQGGTVYASSTTAEVPGSAVSLRRNGSALRFTLQTTGLPRGEAITMWWVIFNFPEHCQHPVPGIMQCGEPDLFDESVAATVLFATGHVVGGSGNGNFAGALTLGDLSGCRTPMDAFGLCRAGLQNPLGAEAHLVVRTHGPAEPRILRDQIRTFAGGCTPESSFGAGTGPYACDDLQFAIVLAP